jgi:hypothetical protein
MRGTPLQTTTAITCLVPAIERYVQKRLRVDALRALLSTRTNPLTKASPFIQAVSLMAGSSR